MLVRNFCIIVVKTYTRIFYRHKVYGIKHLPKGGGIIASNHSSFLDPPLIGISCPDEVHFLARSSLFNFAPFRWLLKKLLTHPVVKGRENVSTIKKACELILSGKKVAIFPEGTRTRDGNLRKGQLGVGMLVLKTECQVIPTYIHGTYEIWNSDKKYPAFTGKTACVFGRSLDFSHLVDFEKKEAQAIISDTIMEAIARLQQWYLAGAKGTPP